MEMEELLRNIAKLHTTKLGIERVRKNLVLNEDVVVWCKNAICSKEANIIRRGKNFYITILDNQITVNAKSLTIITAHKIKGN